MSGFLPALPRLTCHPAVQPRIATPLGDLTFSAALSNRQLPAVPDTLSRLPSGALIAHWTEPAADLELLVTRYDPDLDPDHWAPLTDCWAAVWRVQARTALPRVQLSATLSPLPSGVDSGFDGGQALAAITFDNSDTKLTLGGPDEEDICLGAADSSALATRWGRLVDRVYATTRDLGWGVDYGNNEGLEWTLPSMEQGDRCLIHVVVAWSPPTNEEDANTWFAVATTPENIIRQAADA